MAPAVLIHPRFDVADAEGHRLAVGERIPDEAVQRQLIQRRFAERLAPPQARVVHMQGGHLRAREHDLPLLPCRQADRHGEIRPFKAAAERTLDRLVRQVRQRAGNLQLGAFQRLQVDHRLHEDVVHLQVAGHADRHVAPEADALAERTRVPVDVADVQVPGLRTEDLDFQPVLPAEQVRHVVFEMVEDAVGLFRRSKLFAVEIDVGAVVDALEFQEIVLAFLPAQRDTGRVPPGVVEPRAVDPGIGIVFIQVGRQLAAVEQGAGDGPRHGRRVPGGGPVLAEGPAVGEFQDIARGVSGGAGHGAGQDQRRCQDFQGYLHD